MKAFPGILGLILGAIGIIAAFAGSQADVSVLEQRYALLFGLILGAAGFSAAGLALFSHSERRTLYSLGSLVVAFLALIGLLTLGP